MLQSHVKMAKYPLSKEIQESELGTRKFVAHLTCRMNKGSLRTQVKLGTRYSVKAMSQFCRISHVSNSRLRPTSLVRSF